MTKKQLRIAAAQRANIILEAQHIASTGFAPMEEAKPKEVDQDFENKKHDVEYNNHQAKMEHLASRFTEKLSEHPITIYDVSYDKNPKKARILDSVTEVRVDVGGTGGGVSIAFGADGGLRTDDWVGINGKGVASGDNGFGRDWYKIDNDAFQMILTMLSELIKASGYNDTEKQSMFNSAIEYFKNRIIKGEGITGD
jgi:hypothetical protein